MAQPNLSTVYEPSISAFDKLETLRFASQQLQSKLEGLSLSAHLEPRLAVVLETFSRLAQDWDSLCEDVNESCEAELRESEALEQQQLARLRAEKQREAKLKRELAVRSVSMEMKEKEFSRSLQLLETMCTQDVDLHHEIVQAHRINKQKLSSAADSTLAEFEKEFKLVLASDSAKELPKPSNESLIDVSLMNESQVEAAYDKAMDENQGAEGEEVSGWISDLESDKEESLLPEAVKVKRLLDMLRDPELEDLPRQLLGSKLSYLDKSSLEASKEGSVRMLTPNDSRNFNAPRPILKKSGFIVTSPRSAVLAELDQTSSARSGYPFAKFEEMKDASSNESSIKPIKSPHSLIPATHRRAQPARSTGPPALSVRPGSARRRLEPRNVEERGDLLV
jgi:hypothetical protein